MTLQIGRVTDDLKREPTLEEREVLQDRWFDLQRRYRDGSLNPPGVLELFQKVQEGFVIQRAEVTKLKLVASGVRIPPAPAGKAKDCFRDSRVFAYRDADIDNLLSIPPVGLGRASGSELTEPLSFQEMIGICLGAMDLSLNDLGQLLQEQGKTWSLLQIDHAIRQCEGGENPLELCTNGYANFFPTKINGDVFVVSASRYPDGWIVLVYRFECAIRWLSGLRVLLRN